MSSTHYSSLSSFFFFTDTPTSDIYTLSLHDALPIYNGNGTFTDVTDKAGVGATEFGSMFHTGATFFDYDRDGKLDLYAGGDRKSTRLNSSHTVISYAVFCLKKKKKKENDRLKTNTKG